MEKIKIFQSGTDGFGHQLEGTLRLLSLSLNNKADYDYHYNKTYTFEHNNIDVEKLTQYINSALMYLSKYEETIKQISSYSLKYVNRESYRTFGQIIAEDADFKNVLYYYDGVGCGRTLPPNFESSEEFEFSLPILREAFVKSNIYLPIKEYSNDFINVAVHIRLGDAVGTRPLDNENLYNVVTYFQTKKETYKIIIHSDGDVNHLQSENTYIKDKNTDVLKILSDFIHADILIINYSSLSIAAHILANNEQIVICPDKAGVTFEHRILKKCIKCSQFLQNPNDKLFL